MPSGPCSPTCGWTAKQVNALGAKGLGEVSMTGVAAAIANAVFNATGQRVRELPVTLDKVMG